MSNQDQIWIGQHGEKHGPYSEAKVRQWLSEGKLAADVLAWHEGMADWVPLAHMFPDAAARNGATPPPMAPAQAPTPKPAAGTATWPDSLSARPDGSLDTDAAERTELPSPPSLHWAWVLLFAVLSLGIFGLVWPFIQANWVRKIDRQSHATMLFGLAMVCLVIGYPLYFAGIASMLHGGDASMVTFAGPLLLGYWVLYIVAYFSMAGSMRNKLARRAPPFDIGGVTLFFFTMYYLQGQLSWLARWKHTGDSSPAAPKGVFWVVFLLSPVAIAILAAITIIPAYQDYLARAQVSEGAMLATGAKQAMASYYQAHDALPSDNAAAGLARGTSISGRYVSSVEIAAGVVTVTFDSANTDSRMRHHTLVFEPEPGKDGIRWDCSKYSTVPSGYLPLSCRK